MATDLVTLLLLTAKGTFERLLCICSLQHGLCLRAGVPLVRWSEPPTEEGKERYCSQNDGCVIQVRRVGNRKIERRTIRSEDNGVEEYCADVERPRKSPQVEFACLELIWCHDEA